MKILTLFFVLPCFLCFNQSIENLPTGINTAEHIVACSDSFKEFLSGIVTGTMMRNIG